MKLRSSVTILLSAGLLASWSCAESSESPESAALRTARARWEAAGVHHCEMRYRVTGAWAAATGVVRVRGHAVESLEVVHAFAEEGTGADVFMLLTAEKMFDLIEAAGTEADRVTVTL